MEKAFELVVEDTWYVFDKLKADTCILKIRGRRKYNLLDEKFKQVLANYSSENPINFLICFHLSDPLDLIFMYFEQSIQKFWIQLKFFFELFQHLLQLNDTQLSPRPGAEIAHYSSIIPFIRALFRSLPMKLQRVAEEQTNQPFKWGHLSKILIVTRFWADYVLQKLFWFSKKSSLLIPLNRIFNFSIDWYNWSFFLFTSNLCQRTL